MTSTTQTTTSASCPGCKRLTVIPEGFKVVVCAYCGAKVAGADKVATK